MRMRERGTHHITANATARYDNLTRKLINQ